jgi:DNA polymerase
MLVGINPGKTEDREGFPFVGKAGKLLTKHLSVIGLRREDLWITNLVKDLTPSNREPTEEETLACVHSIFNEELKIVNPLVIVPLGSYVMFYLTGEGRQGITKLAGKPFLGLRYGKVEIPAEILIFPMLHPSGILQNPTKENLYRKHWQELLKFLQQQGIVN